MGLVRLLVPGSPDTYRTQSCVCEDRLSKFGWYLSQDSRTRETSAHTEMPAFWWTSSTQLRSTYPGLWLPHLGGVWQLQESRNCSQQHRHKQGFAWGHLCSLFSAARLNHPTSGHPRLGVLLPWEPSGRYTPILMKEFLYRPILGSKKGSWEFAFRRLWLGPMSRLA